MANDILKAFRTRVDPQGRQQLPATPSPAPAIGRSNREAYEPFGTVDRKRARLDIRCKIGKPSHAINYSFLHDLTYDRGIWTILCLTVSGLAIEIRGRNMRPIVNAVLLGGCYFIQEYDENEFILPQPLDPEAPVVESIRVDVLHGMSAPQAG